MERRHKCDEEDLFVALKSSTSGFMISVSGVVLLSLAFILMLVIICCLCYVICRMRNRIYKEEIFSKQIVPINEYDQQQSSNIPEPTSMKIITFDSPFKSTNTLPIVKSDVKEKLKPSPKLPKHPKPDYMKPANGGKLPMQPVITPDQMTKVCVEVLSKMKRNQSTSLTHLDELMKMKNNEDENAEEYYKFEDNFKYDVLPRQGEAGGDDVYDCPQMGDNSNHNGNEQDYYDNLPIREDMYANVKFIHDIRSNHNML